MTVMELPKYDVLIKSSSKDYPKLKNVVNSLRFLIPQPSKIFIVSVDGYKPILTNYDDKIVAVKDEDVFPGCDRNRLKYRINWTFINLMSLFQNITEQDYYLDVQADNFFIKPLELFTNNKPNFFISPQHNHFHQQYWNYSNVVFGLDKVKGNDESFIVEFMMYNKNISKELLKTHSNFTGLFNKSCEIINKNCYPADQEIYGSWCIREYPTMYNIQRNVQTILMGKTYPDNYTEEEIDSIINNNNFINEISISLHTWGDIDSNQQNGYV